MRKRAKAHHPQLESLESKSLLSGAAATALDAQAEASVAKAAPVTLSLTGTETGSFRLRQSSSGQVYSITAKGSLTPIGRATASGKLEVLSGISSGPPSGTLRVATKKGALKLEIPESVTLPVGLPTAASPNEIVDTYVITKGTGIDKGDTGSGVVEFTFNRTTSSAFKSSGGQVDVTFTTLLVT